MILTASPGTCQRFIETFDFFFQSVTQQALDRASGVIPDLESYIALRRDTSGKCSARAFTPLDLCLHDGADRMQAVVRADRVCFPSSFPWHARY
jgi:hypothetical protein